MRRQYKTIQIAVQDIFYREAGPKDAPVIVLLHGFPTSSHMFRNLIPVLAQNYHVIAPDYPGYGNSSMPLVTEYDYSFDHLADVMDEFLIKKGIDKYTLYVMDYGAPIGFRIAAKHPERVQGLIIQNGNAYDEGLLAFWDPIKAFWKDKTAENDQALRDALLTIDATNAKQNEANCSSILTYAIEKAAEVNLNVTLITSLGNLRSEIEAKGYQNASLQNPALPQT